MKEVDTEYFTFCNIHIQSLSKVTHNLFIIFRWAPKAMYA